MLLPQQAVMEIQARALHATAGVADSLPHVREAQPHTPSPKEEGTEACRDKWMCAREHTHRASARNSPTLRPLRSSQQTFGEMPFSVDFRVYLQIRRKSGEMATAIKITQYARSGKVKPHFEVSETMRQRGLSRTHTQNNTCSLPL